MCQTGRERPRPETVLPAVWAGKSSRHAEGFACLRVSGDPKGSRANLRMAATVGSGSFGQTSIRAASSPPSGLRCCPTPGRLASEIQRRDDFAPPSAPCNALGRGYTILTDPQTALPLRATMSFDIRRQVTNWKATTLSLIVALIGLLAVVTGLALPNEYAKELIKEIGSVLLGIGGISFLWEMFSKREFRNETLDLVKISAALDAARLESLLIGYLEAEWKHLLASAEKLDIFFAYGGTWRSVYTHELRKLVETKNMRVRVILPDPDNSTCVAELARRFGYTTQKTAEKIREGIAAFQELQTECKNGASVEIRLTAIQPLLASYLFGNKAVCTTYRHKPTRGLVPTHIVRRGGTMYAFLEEEFDYVWLNSTELSAATGQPTAEAAPVPVATAQPSGHAPLTGGPPVVQPPSGAGL